MPDRPTAEVRTLLAKFGLGAEHVLRAASTLSPGERTRAGLALLQAEGSTCSCSTSRPTTSTCRRSCRLEQAVESYDGTLVLVTHDRRMLDTVRATRRWHVDAGRVDELDPARAVDVSGGGAARRRGSTGATGAAGAPTAALGDLGLHLRPALLDACPVLRVVRHLLGLDGGLVHHLLGAGVAGRLATRSNSDAIGGAPCVVGGRGVVR
ncbi:hypothetical protein GCM10025868_44410 [Angustibacter aerolatus]|uniref:ABC transporter domain-containing protein n=1 Tax=Angustibacter aerolatus TaxID=1162965 RepID=A0ABQ6JNQ5_9ACTN|nr:hypothetical protein GCM10025868_44410 [Angustibacter aerolatus]